MHFTPDPPKSAKRGYFGCPGGKGVVVSSCTVCKSCAEPATRSSLQLSEFSRCVRTIQSKRSGRYRNAGPGAGGPMACSSNAATQRRALLVDSGTEINNLLDRVLTNEGWSIERLPD